MGPVLRWSWLLGVALMAPAALPAGGADRRQPQPRRRAVSGPLHTATDQPLRLSPLAMAPRLRTLKAGTTLRLLRRWSAADGQDWLHVQTSLESNAVAGSVLKPSWWVWGRSRGLARLKVVNHFQPMVPKTLGHFIVNVVACFALGLVLGSVKPQPTQASLC